MSNDIIFMDSFSGSIGELKPKQRGDLKTVLRVLLKDPNVSTWDMDDGKRYPLWKTILKLEAMKYVVSVNIPYPWHRYEVTEAGKKFLSENE